MAKALQEKVVHLIEHYFPWGQDGYPSDPAPHRLKDREKEVLLWLEGRTRDFGTAALALIARILPVLRDLETQTSASSRLLARIDSSSLLKTPHSILEKMVRDWEPESGKPPKIGFENFLEEMTDLGRFRIVANFLSDAELVARTLEEAYGPPKAALSEPQRMLRQDYALKQNRMNSTLHIRPAERSKGERCSKGVFHPKLPELRHLNIEVQVQTLLQEAWDKKDHFLIYEPRRRGEPIGLKAECEMFAMSELLYVADLTFDRLRTDLIPRPK